MLVICIGLFIGCEFKEANARKRIKDLTEVEVPENSIIVYHHLDDVFVNGSRT